MKRYRVWQANREIFLFPENWLEPEFRDDKTDLFQELEGALLQGDVSNDLAEDALFKYVKKLEQIARLEIVTIHCQEDSLDPRSNILYVIGRTHSLPHKYFHRRYAHQMWTLWKPINTDIEGDHVIG
jgi:Neuraminidase-like domain